MWEGDHFLKYLILNDGQIYFEMLCVQTDSFFDIIWWCNKLQNYLFSIGASIPSQAIIPLSIRTPVFRITIKGVVIGPTPFNLDKFYAFVHKEEDGRSEKVETSIQNL